MHLRNLRITETEAGQGRLSENHYIIEKYFGSFQPSTVN
jgi:hypothetical protein